MPRKRRHPIALADLVHRYLGKQERQGRGAEALALKVFAAFERIGPPITEHAEPVFFRGGNLTLSVNASSWMTELAMLEPQLLKRINKLLGKRVVKRLRLRAGNVRPPSPPEKPPIPLSFKQQEDVDRWAASIPDPKVRDAMKRAAAASLRRGDAGSKAAKGPPGPMLHRDKPEYEEKPRYGYGFRKRQK